MSSSKRVRRALRVPAVPALMLAPAVIAARLPILATEAAGTRRRTETTKAMAEKAAAAAEGMVAAQMSLVKSMWSFWPEVASGKVPALVNGKALQDATDAAMKPINRRVRANFRRLSRG